MNNYFFFNLEMYALILLSNGNRSALTPAISGCTVREYHTIEINSLFLMGD